MGRRPRDAGVAALLILVLAAPLAFGAAPAWGWGTLAVGIALLLLADATRGAPTGSGSPVPGWALTLAGAVAAVALWQGWAPWPGHPLRLAAGAALAEVAPSPALDPEASRAALARLGAAAGVLWLAARGAGPSGARGALTAVAAAGAVHALYALAVRAFELDAVLWLGRSAYDAASGPFVARGAFAAFCGLAMLAAAGLAGSPRPGRARWPLVAAWLLLAAALLASQSRAGLGATLVAHLLLLALLARRHGHGAGRIVLAGVLLLAATGLAVLASGLDARLWQLGADLEHRLAIWRAALAAIADRPWLGHGLGGFSAVFELYRPPGAARAATSAHSGPLEWAAEAGIPTALAWHALLAGLGLTILRRTRRAPAGPAGPVAVAALSLLAVQGAVDFAPQVPAVTLLGALLIGLGLAGQRAPASEPSARASAARTR